MTRSLFMKKTVLADNQICMQPETNTTEKPSLAITDYDKLDINNLNNPQIAFYAGSFDPFTNGHWALVCEALTKCDKIYIGIGVNPDKKSLLTPQERTDSIQKTISDFVSYYTTNPHQLKHLNEVERIAYQRLIKNHKVIEVISYNGLTIDTALKLKSTVLVRGVRNDNDKNDENTLNKINQILTAVRGRRLETLILKPQNQDEIAHISSSTVKSLCAVNEYIALQGFVSPAIHNKITEKYLKPIFQTTLEQFGVRDKNKIESSYNFTTKLNSYTSFLINCINIQDALNGPIKSDIKNYLMLSSFYRGLFQKGTSLNTIKQQLTDILGDNVTPLIDLITVSPQDNGDTQLSPEQYLMLSFDKKIKTYSEQYPLYTSLLNNKQLQTKKIKSSNISTFNTQNNTSVKELC